MHIQAFFRYGMVGLPKPAKTLSILLARVPVAHYFTQPYVHSDFIAHRNIGFPFVRKQSPQCDSGQRGRISIAQIDAYLCVQDAAQ